MPYMNIPPVMSVQAEDSMDIMIARDTARRAAGLLGFTTPCKAQIAAAVAALAEIILKAGSEGTINLNGVQSGSRIGIQISCQADWLKGLSDGPIAMLKDKLGKMVDEVKITGQDPPTLNLLFWLLPPRQVKDKEG